MFDANTVDTTTLHTTVDRFSVGTKKFAALAYVIDNGPWRERPDADEVFVLDFADADVRIPWPKGMTVKQAILAWAAKEIGAS